MILGDGHWVEEERGTGKGLLEEIFGEERDPLEDREAGARLEHEHGDCLLQDEAHDDSSPDANISIQSRRRAYRGGAYHGMCLRCLEVAQKPNWKTNRPRTEIARSP